MKHNIKITILLVFIFFLAQITGLFIVREYVNTSVVINETTGEKITQIKYNDIEIVNTKIEHPDINENLSFIYIAIVIVIATLMVLLIVKFKKLGIWKVWFSISIFLASYIALEPFIKKILILIPILPVENIKTILKIVTVVIVLFLVFMKVYKKNMIVHNITEIIMYGGIAAIFIPVINVFSAAMLLIFISIYDMYAVWKSKHMVTMANFQTKSNVFAGLYLLYDQKSKKIISKLKTDKKLDGKQILKENTKTNSVSKQINKNTPNNKSDVKQAILGGGDIAFPLIFAGTILKASGSLYLAWIVVAFSTIALSLLFLFSKPGKFYPAMPYISSGCFAGYFVVYLIQLFL